MTVMRAAAGYLLSDWYRKLTSVFVAILLWQWFDMLENYWWDETFAIVHGLLLAGVAVELLVPGPRWIRVTLQAMALLALNVAHSGFRWVPLPRERGFWDDWMRFLYSQIEPYFWIAVGVLVAFLFAAFLTRTRMQVLAITGLCLLSLTIVDSFTPIYLWDEIAWTVFVGLAWLVAEHFARFQEKHPESWSYLLEYPMAFVAPTAVVLTLVMASGVFVPTVRPLIKDPYTVWKESRGESVPAFLGEKGADTSGNQEEKRDTRSGYGRDDTKLGGGFRFDYSEVFTVSTSKRSYWRGESKAVYTGAGWVDAPESRNREAISGLEIGQELPGALEAEEGVERQEIKQMVTMIRKDQFPVLFGAPTIKRIERIGEEGRAIPTAAAWLPESGELRWPSGSAQAKYPETYSIVSEAPVLDEAKLAKAGTGSFPEDSQYLQLPEALPQRVRDLADDITAAAKSPYEKARAIETYLKENFDYTNEPDISKKSSKDFVDAFLFEIKEGYCDYYSTAMAVLSRSVGLPARWVKGYAPGFTTIDMNPAGIPEIAEDPNRGGLYTVRNADAHSWVEIYFDGFGWIPFEATAGFSFPYAVSNGADTAVPETEQEETVTEPAAEAKVVSVPWGWIAGIAAAVLAAAAFGFRHSLNRLWRRWQVRSLSNNQRIVWETEKLIKLCGKRGLQRSQNETLRESMRRWAETRRSLGKEFDDVLAVFERAKYSAAEATHEEADRIAERIRAIRERL